MIEESIQKLIAYGLKTGLISKQDEIYATNKILEVLHLQNYETDSVFVCEEPEINLEKTLNEILDFAYDTGVINDNGIAERDLLDTRLMDCLMPRPSEVIQKFYSLYEKSPEAATDYFYRLSQDSNYIRRYRIEKDKKWVTETPYGQLDITINLSKPEKDPRAIAAARNAQAGGYPKCLLCMENVGYAGHLNHPARQNHRVIPITIGGTQWGFQYSPYVYYNEHCIIFNGVHTPMKIDRDTFVKFFDFLKQFPHYNVGSNADLPIVGGSILSHDHFQGGKYEFPMARAGYLKKCTLKGYEDVECGILNWPLSVLRIRSTDADRLIELGDHILQSWRGYTDEDAFIYAETEGEMHNTITPIARKVGDTYELDLALRNNITTEEHPLGVYHPHENLHHIKKENIGLIEAMGLAILPARLKEELRILADYLVEGKPVREQEQIAKHADWATDFSVKYSSFTRENIDEILQREVGLVFMQVLEDAGVYKLDENGMKNFLKFVSSL